MPPLFEALERRELFAVSLDDAGWTVITPPRDARVVYVSSSTGDDDRSGTSPSSPVKTLQAGVSRLRDGSGDQLLLKAGDVWREPFGLFRKSGRSASEPLVIGAYGAGDRPLIQTGTSDGFVTGAASEREVRNVALVGLHFQAHTRDPDSPAFDPAAGAASPAGLRLMAESSGVLVEDCKIEAYATNVVIEDSLGGIRDVTLRRSIIVDAYGGSIHAQGLFAKGVNGLTLEENVFDHNGWDNRAPAGRATMFNHNAYLTSDNTNVVVRGNVFANAASHGLQARAGGKVLDNFFYGNPIGMSFGLVNGAYVKAGGVSGIVNGNVFLGTRDIDGAPRGMGIQVGNTRPGGPTVLSNNVFDDDSVVDAGQGREGGRDFGVSPAFTLEYGKDNRNEAEGVGINGLSLQGNVVHRWAKGISVQSGMEPGGRGPRALSGLTVRGNDFQKIRDGEIVQHFAEVGDAHERWSDNRYDADESDRVVLAGGRGVTLGKWSDDHEPDAQSARPPYVDAGRGIESYEATLEGGEVGDGADAASFFASARERPRRTWQPQYAALSLIEHVRAGYEERGAPPRDWRPPTPPTASASVPDTVTTADAALTFTVTYEDDKGVDVASLDGEDLRLVRKGEGGARLPASLVSAQEGVENTVVATYHVDAPRTVWRLQDRGRYTLAVAEDQVRDTEGFAMPAGGIADVTLNVLKAPEPPVVRKIKFRAKGPQTLTVRFSTDLAPGTLRQQSLVLTREDGLVVDASTFAVAYDPASQSATWSFPGQAGGVLPEGRYAVTLSAADITDAEGRPLDGNKDGLGGDDFVWAKPLVIKPAGARKR